MNKVVIPHQEESIDAIYDESGKDFPLLLLAHGAGAPMTHVFMDKLVKELKRNDINTLRFNFPYISKGRKAPGSPKANIAAWRSVVHWTLREFTSDIYMAGKSYGGRMASHLIVEDSLRDEISGLIYFGFPLHAPGKKSMDRAEHLSNVRRPQLFIQGEKDALADISLMRELIKKLKGASLFEIEGGDHSLKAKGKPLEESLLEIGNHTRLWINSLGKE